MKTVKKSQRTTVKGAPVKDVAVKGLRARYGYRKLARRGVAIDEVGTPVMKLSVPRGDVLAASARLASAGITLREVVRTFVSKLADDGIDLLDLMQPNATTLEAFRELDEGRGHKADSVEEMMRQLNAEG
jgi:antitoxin component of RelBE/YafQ-DinJ toxin-antitoxin module